MDFSKIKSTAKILQKKAISAKDTALKAGNKALDYSSAKLASSSMTLKSQKEIDAFLEKSQSTQFTDTKSGEKKTFTHKVILIVVEIDNDFFTSLLYKFPLLSAKAFSQNIALKIADAKMKDLDLKKIPIDVLPTLIIFENKKIIKQISGEENIQKVVKSLSLDINKAIEEL